MASETSDERDLSSSLYLMIKISWLIFAQVPGPEELKGGGGRGRREERKLAENRRLLRAYSCRDTRLDRSAQEWGHTDLQRSTHPSFSVHTEACKHDQRASKDHTRYPCLQGGVFLTTFRRTHLMTSPSLTGPFPSRREIYF